MGWWRGLSSSLHQKPNVGAWLVQQVDRGARIAAWASAQILQAVLGGRWVGGISVVRGMASVGSALTASPFKVF